MGGMVLNWLPWLSGDVEQGLEEIPDGRTVTKKESVDVYEVVFEYQNGDTETVETYPSFGPDGDVFEYTPDPYEPEPGMEDVPVLAPDPERVHYAVLARPPKVWKTREEVWQLSYDTYYEWAYPHHLEPDGWFLSGSKEWVETVDAGSVTFEKVRETSVS